MTSFLTWPKANTVPECFACFRLEASPLTLTWSPVVVPSKLPPYLLCRACSGWTRVLTVTSYKEVQKFHGARRKCNNVTMRLFLASSDMKETEPELELFWALKARFLSLFRAVFILKNGVFIESMKGFFGKLLVWRGWIHTARKGQGSNSCSRPACGRKNMSIHTLLYFLYDLERALLPYTGLPLGKQIEHPLLSSLKQKRYYKHVPFQLIAPQPPFLLFAPPCSLFFLQLSSTCYKSIGGNVSCCMYIAVSFVRGCECK